ncbi:MAG TPA: type II secretion system F family protein [Mycobacteriales bacterium]|nr:type II secretion system F family protein [Mycobacteriales bacterium]
MTPALACAALVAAAVALASGGGGATRVRDLSGLAAPRVPPGAWVAAAAVAALALGPAVSLAVPPGALAARALLRRRTAANAARDTRAALPGACRTAAAELRAGAPPPEAFARAAADAPPALAAALRRAAALGPAAPWPDLPGGERLAAVAALWRVAADAGSGLADGLDRLADALAGDERLRAEVAAQLAGPRTSAAVLAALPLGGIALAAALGARPVTFLLRTPPGLACLLAGAALDATGVWWVRRLTARAAP